MCLYIGHELFIGNENSFAASEMLHQQLLQKEEEVESLVMQVQQLQVSV